MMRSLVMPLLWRLPIGAAARGGLRHSSLRKKTRRFPCPTPAWPRRSPRRWRRTRATSEGTSACRGTPTPPAPPTTRSGSPNRRNPRRTKTTRTKRSQPVCAAYSTSAQALQPWRTRRRSPTTSQRWPRSRARTSRGRRSRQVTVGSRPTRGTWRRKPQPSRVPRRRKPVARRWRTQRTTPSRSATSHGPARRGCRGRRRTCTSWSRARCRSRCRWLFRRAWQTTVWSPSCMRTRGTT
mmetsp:Transcript_37513/g.112009  ORF Transcript_37513/g.112009 Transcript_37513/m.112009 type:complete len:238 (+) Transcript_37513:797-1510(+)